MYLLCHETGVERRTTGVGDEDVAVGPVRPGEEDGLGAWRREENTRDYADEADCLGGPCTHQGRVRFRYRVRRFLDPGTRRR